MNFTTNTVLCSNIKLVAREHDIKISELEKLFGVSRGYISRIKKTPRVLPSLDFMIRLSDESGYTINALLNDDLSIAGEDQLLIDKFIAKLNSDTIYTNSIDWIDEPADNSVFNDINYFEGDMYLEGKAFYYEMDARHIVHISQAYNAEDEEENVTEICAWMSETNSDIYPLCSTLTGDTERRLLNELLRNAENAFSKPVLMSDCKQVIKEYLHEVD